MPLLCRLRIDGSRMRICDQCGEQFTPKGRQKVCKVCKDGMQERLQTPEETKPQRPIDRFAGNRVIFPGQVGMRLRRGN